MKTGAKTPQNPELERRYKNPSYPELLTVVAGVSDTR
jgi:hypothetical protein